MPTDLAAILALLGGNVDSCAHTSRVNSATVVIRRKWEAGETNFADVAPSDVIDFRFLVTALGASAGTRTRDDFASRATSSAADKWHATGAGAAVGWQRLREVRSLLGTGEWRTERLTPETVATAEAFFQSFAAIVPDLEPRVAPTDAGGVMFEWENGDRELLVEIRPDGALEVLQVRGADEVELELTLDDAVVLATWLVST